MQTYFLTAPFAMFYINRLRDKDQIIYMAMLAA